MKNYNNNNDDVVRKNYEIKSQNVLVIYEDDNLGVLHIKDARAMAKEHELDLVEINSNVQPPVCRIVDYGKWSYDKQKRLKKNGGKKSVLKKIEFKSAIDQHDLETKVSKIVNFLKSGNSVLISLLFKGRHRAHADDGSQLIDDVLKHVEEYGKPDGAPAHQGRNKITVKVSPK